MRILMINHEFTITGASTVFLRLARHLRAAGHAIEIFPCNPADGPIRTYYLAENFAILEQVDFKNFDLAIANTVCAASLVLQTAPKLKTIWFLHETEIGLNILLKSPNLAAAFRLAAAVVYQTDYQREVYRSFTYQLDAAKFHIIPNGVEVAADATRPEVAPKTSALRVVQVGSVEPRKRPGDLIRAVAMSGLDLECVICGKFFVLEEEAKTILEQLPARFRLSGETEPEETLAWLASADFFCLASGSESQPVSVFEAGALGKPLILSDLPAYHGVFSHGRNCLLFPPGHIEMLALTLRMAASSPRLRAQLGEAARKTAAGFSQAAFLQKFEILVKAMA